MCTERKGEEEDGDETHLNIHKQDDVLRFRALVRR
jgi:hypothetical protein